MNKKILLCTAAVFTASVLFAHFQMVYTPTSVIDEEVKSVPFKLVFTHPFESGHTMDIGKNEKGEVKGMKNFFITHKEKTIDAVDQLKEINFSTNENSGKGYDFMLDKDTSFRGGGDWVLVAVPHPYYEGSEDIYIQQITKVMVNKGDLATDWQNRVADGYPEILPLVKPYDVWVGGIFRGIVVDKKGNPVPNAEIEVEYVNYDFDMGANKLGGNPKTDRGAAVILADDNGVFSFVPTAEGYWGFAALGAGGELEHEGKELSMDAVLWIEASAVK